ncbi:MAG: aldo/keto reductase [Deltaproteobacteria bacterium]|nr:aldo/keto reductase [Deltaproteobacteria bacterium]
MRLRTLGRSGLRVSELCLGAMTFGTAGWGCDEQTSLDLVDRFLEAGGNFVDTADIYADGRSEEICGKALAGRRERFVLATKCTMPTGRGANQRGSSRKHVREACEASLRRLKTDYIDLYQVHAEDLSTPLEETLCALDDLVRAGKVLYLGCSNYRAYRIARAVTWCEARGLNRFVSLQPQYNLLVRTIEREHFDACRELGLGILPWSPLAAGMLTGKIQRGSRPPDARLGQRDIPIYKDYFTDRAFAIVDVVRESASALGVTPAALAIAWQLAKPEISSVIIGARTRSQLDDNLAAGDVAITPEILDRLEQATAPAPEYPGAFLAWVQRGLDPGERR